MSTNLLGQLSDLEEDVYHAGLRECHEAPAIAIRAIVAHASETLDELCKYTSSSIVAALSHSVSRLVHEALGEEDDVLYLAQKGVPLVLRIHAQAKRDGDRARVRWCERWLYARTRLLEQAMPVRNDPLGVPRPAMSMA